MKLKALWEKYRQSGTTNNPALDITDDELFELHEKLVEVEEFLVAFNPAYLGVVANRINVLSTLAAREANGIKV